MNDSQHLHTRLIRITGRVQGVGFRAWTRDSARELQIAGWVRNESDGSVTALLHGRRDAVRIMIERMQQGPPAAAVDRIDLQEAAIPATTQFEIRRTP